MERTHASEKFKTKRSSGGGSMEAKNTAAEDRKQWKRTSRKKRQNIHYKVPSDHRRRRGNDKNHTWRHKEKVRRVTEKSAADESIERQQKEKSENKTEEGERGGRGERHWWKDEMADEMFRKQRWMNERLIPLWNEAGPFSLSCLLSLSLGITTMKTLPWTDSWRDEDCRNESRD